MIFLRTTISPVFILKHESLLFTSKVTPFTKIFLNCSPLISSFIFRFFKRIILLISESKSTIFVLPRSISRLAAC